MLNLVLLEVPLVQTDSLLELLLGNVVKLGDAEGGDVVFAVMLLELLQLLQVLLEHLESVVLLFLTLVALVVVLFELKKHLLLIYVLLQDSVVVEYLAEEGLK